jgi:hypothetical protein
MEQTLIEAMGGRALDLIVVSDGEAILGSSKVVQLVKSDSLTNFPNLPDHWSPPIRNHASRAGIGDQGSGAIGISR